MRGLPPAIRKLGGQYHPDKPYDDPRVTTHLTDGRTFLRTAPEGEYDLVVFALVDSLVLHAGAGNVRLESYLFTEEAFADAARVTKPTGTMASFVGLLAGRSKKVATLDEINDAAASGWAGKN